MGGTGQGLTGPGVMQGDANQGMMGRGTTQGGGGGMICPMMSDMMQGGQSMMGSGIMIPNMMRGSTGDNECAVRIARSTGDEVIRG